TLFLGNNDHATGRWYHGLDDARQALGADMDLAPFERERRLAQQARRWILANPKTAARLYVRKLGLLFDGDQGVADLVFAPPDQPRGLARRTGLPGGTAEELPGKAPAKVLLFVGWCAVTALELAGIALLLIRRGGSTEARGDAWILVGGAALLLLTSAWFL